MPGVNLKKQWLRTALSASGSPDARPPPSQTVCRQLLGTAVNIAAAEEDFPGGHSHDPALGKQPLQAPRCHSVGTRIEERHDHPAVGDVEIDVARGKPFAGCARLRAFARNDTARLFRAHDKWTRHGQPRHLQTPPPGIALIIQPLPGIERDGVLRVTLVVGPGQADLCGTREAREIIDVSVGLVVEYALAEPDDLAHTQVVAPTTLDPLAAHHLIAIDMEQALLG